MTDKEKLVQLFTEFGIEFEDNENIVLCEYGEDKIDGYPGFYTKFEFDNDGNFELMGAWE